MNYAFRFSGSVTALRAGTRAKSNSEDLTPKSSHGSVTHAPNKLLICTLVHKLLTITWRNFSKVNMSLNHLPFELLGLILANIFPDEWNHYDSGLEVLNLRTVCRKYSKRVFKVSAE